MKNNESVCTIYLHFSASSTLGTTVTPSSSAGGLPLHLVHQRSSLVSSPSRPLRLQAAARSHGSSRPSTPSSTAVHSSLILVSSPHPAPPASDPSTRHTSTPSSIPRPTTCLCSSGAMLWCCSERRSWKADLGFSGTMTERSNSNANVSYART